MKKNPQRSASHWSKPQTPAQVSYFSTHAPKRRVCGIVQIAIQIIWAAISFIACKNLFDWAFSHTPGLIWLSDYLAVATLVTLHVLLRTTYNTYWYDRLDNRTETDSSFFLPLLIMFELTDKEADKLVSQFVIPSKGRLDGALPFAFSEQGVAMLSTVIRSEKPIPRKTNWSQLVTSSKTQKKLTKITQKQNLPLHR